MLKKLCFIILSVVLLIPAANAQTKQIATHVWIDAGSASTMVNVGSVEMCDLMVQQAARIEGNAEGHCYNGRDLLKEIECKINTSGKGKYYKGGPVECE